MRKIGSEFDVMDNEKGLDGSRPITEAIATRQGGDVPPERGKRGTADAAQALARQLAATSAEPSSSRPDQPWNPR
jgi:hypothetical protein